MSDEKRLVKAALFAPPPAQFAKGAGLFFEADNNAELLAQLTDAVDSGLVAKLAEANAVLLAESGLVQAQPSPAEQGATLSQGQPAGGNVVNLRTCPHGKMVGPTEGVAKTGRNAGNKYLKWTCPANDRNCKAVFENP